MPQTANWKVLEGADLQGAGPREPQEALGSTMENHGVLGITG